ncbi:signal peptidase II [Saccharothrix australiensis]|uniref:Lipoprotein signal peptidase n=1 Tax=Saccharothrix australiensis TaxID=2072 RepID=A0A495W8A3_9PSEU|nr:signal peptidase II [Saccharothrix australiensis]RKT56863.1 signal peptidase II [Saccharothrix australiensis]
MLDNGPVSTESNSEPGTGPDGAAATGARPLPKRRVALLAAIAPVVLALDVVTKVIAVRTLEGQEPVELFGGLVYLSFLRNSGAAFGLAEGFTLILALVAFGVVGFILWIARKLRSVGWAVGLGLVLGGALGNLADRVFRGPGPLRGHVVDFISVIEPYGAFFPVFNVADSGICVGGAVIVLMALLQRDYDGTRPAKAGASGTPASGSSGQGSPASGSPASGSPGSGPSGSGAGA